jgi:hypothetical protein
MPLEQLTVVLSMVFLAAGGLMMAQRIRRGRELCDEFQRRLPAEYRAFEEPRPAFFYTTRSAAYSAFVLQRKFLQLPDPQLVAQFEEVRRQEVQTLIFVFGGCAALVVVWLWLDIGVN